MIKLTRKEASNIIEEARRLYKLHETSSSRLGQAIWWCSSQHSTLPENLQIKLYELIDPHRGTEVDFYHEKDPKKVVQKFYELYVQEY